MSYWLLFPVIYIWNYTLHIFFFLNFNRLLSSILFINYFISTLNKNNNHHQSNLNLSLQDHHKSISLFPPQSSLLPWKISIIIFNPIYFHFSIFITFHTRPPFLSRFPFLHYHLPFSPTSSSPNKGITTKTNRY